MCESKDEKRETREKFVDMKERRNIKEERFEERANYYFTFFF